MTLSQDNVKYYICEKFLISYILIFPFYNIWHCVRLTQYQMPANTMSNSLCPVPKTMFDTVIGIIDRGVQTMFDIVAGQCVTVCQADRAIYDIGAWLHKRITQMESLGSGWFYSHITKQKNTRLFRPILTRDGTGTDRNVECMHSIHIGFRSASWKWQSEEYPLPSDSWSGTWHWLAGRLRIWEEIFLCVY